jgi:catechol 2,3-dioxygenase-like lactoylglutathione lyase family enzyme
MTQQEVQAALGAPAKLTEEPGTGFLEWDYANGVAAIFGGAAPGTTVSTIRIGAPYTGRTAEGLGLADGRLGVDRVYGIYRPIAQAPNTLRVVDGDGITVLIGFDAQDHIAAIWLAEFRAPR